MVIFDPFVRFCLLGWDEEKGLRGPGLWVWCTYRAHASTQTISHLDQNLDATERRSKKIEKFFFAKKRKKSIFSTYKT